MIWKTRCIFSGYGLAFLLSTQAAWAVSFGRIDVASHMGEPFYAEAVLHLSDRESLAKTSVGLGSSEDYRILEVYRDKVIDRIRVDIVDDKRGARVTLSSASAIEEAFFHLVLKVRYGRSTHYKKVPVFLDPVVIKDLAPDTQALKKPAVLDKALHAYDDRNVGLSASQPVDNGGLESTFEAHDGWARTARYGPMVFGDTVAIVAHRLRLDKRFTNQQVMVALFEKNKAVFDKGNINLIKAGAYLDVPTANEVAQFSLAQVKRVLSQQNRMWKDMSKQPKYAEVVEAQNTRYTRRIHVGTYASGAGSSPIHASHPATQKKNSVDSNKSSEIESSSGKVEGGQLQDGQKLSMLQKKIVLMEQRMADMERSAVDFGAESSVIHTSGEAVLFAQNKRLEIVVARLNQQLEQARFEATSEKKSATWINYVLAGLALFVVALLLAIVLLLRRKPNNPIAYMQEHHTPQGVAPVQQTLQTAVVESEQTSARDAAELSDVAVEKSRDFLKDADVLLQDGKFDAAEAQARLALAAQGNDPKAHIKLIQVQRAKKNKLLESNALDAARCVLTGGALVSFESMLQAEDNMTAALDSHMLPEQTTLASKVAVEVVEDDLPYADGIDFSVSEDSAQASDMIVSGFEEDMASFEAKTREELEITAGDLPFASLNLDEVDMTFTGEDIFLVQDDERSNLKEHKPFEDNALLLEAPETINPDIEQEEPLLLENHAPSEDAKGSSPMVGTVSELEGLMNDLDGLLDEREIKK